MDMLKGVHMSGDGRGRRRVLLNGRELSGVVYADTARGIVRVYDQPPRVHKYRKRCIQRTRHGIVEVYRIGEGE